MQRVPRPICARTIDCRRGPKFCVERLSGGVSNCVLLVRRLDALGADFVLKQARPQLDTPEPWFCTVERIWREIDVLHVCAEACGNDHVPAVLFEDRANYLFAMTAAPREHRVWKDELMAGRADRAIAEVCGRLMGRMHAATWQNPAIARQLSDDSVFDALRLDPYYRAVASAFPESRPWFDHLIEATRANRTALVHGDFSPKNLLVTGGRVLLIDFECGHFGDPAFDVGFFVSHLVLKAFEHAPRDEPYLSLVESFWDAYEAELIPSSGRDVVDGIASRGARHFAGCAWSRLDGKSRIDYLDEPARRDEVREVCRAVLRGETYRVPNVAKLCRNRLDRF